MYWSTATGAETGGLMTDMTDRASGGRVQRGGFEDHVARWARGCATETACDAPGISIVRWARARSAMKRSSALGDVPVALAEDEPGRQLLPRGRAGLSDSAASVIGRCVAAISAASAAGTSAAELLVEAS